ncbi:hypothetical protein PLICRDRAFT_646822 [Plicaturopsis crispa FD-325 SS-3]|nr:hypothetical protein PLICRDRAFT_646822 [Plicaturopsis crispa FD-325 SS-3]
MFALLTYTLLVYADQCFYRYVVVGKMKPCVFCCCPRPSLAHPKQVGFTNPGRQSMVTRRHRWSRSITRSNSGRSAQACQCLETFPAVVSNNICII